MEFPCGTYERFEHNMRAIALTLENLRAIDRYGVTLGHQQYKGFLALPPAATAQDSWTVDGAAAWLAARTPWVHSGADILGNYETFRKAYREAAKTHHPEAGGSREMFDVLQIVSKLLEEYHGQRKSGGAA